MLEHCATFWNIVEHFATDISFATSCTDMWEFIPDFWNWKHASRKWDKCSGICTRFLSFFCRPRFCLLWELQFCKWGQWYIYWICTYICKWIWFLFSHMWPASWFPIDIAVCLPLILKSNYCTCRYSQAVPLPLMYSPIPPINTSLAQSITILAQALRLQAQLAM